MCFFFFFFCIILYHTCMINWLCIPSFLVFCFAYGVASENRHLQHWGECLNILSMHIRPGRSKPFLGFFGISNEHPHNKLWNRKTISISFSISRWLPIFCFALLNTKWRFFFKPVTGGNMKKMDWLHFPDALPYGFKKAFEGNNIFFRYLLRFLFNQRRLKNNRHFVLKIGNGEPF